MFQKHMTPLTAHSKKGTVKAHKGKGSQMAPMPDRSQIQGLSRPGAQSMNDYAKSTPMAAGARDFDADDPMLSGGGF